MLRAVERHDQADERALARPAGSDERRRRAGRGMEGDVVEHGLARHVGERNVFERDVAVRWTAARRSGRPASSLASSSTSRMRSRPGERLGDLRADRGHLHDRRGEQPGEEDVHDEVAQRHVAVESKK